MCIFSSLFFYLNCGKSRQSSVKKKKNRHSSVLTHRIFSALPFLKNGPLSQGSGSIVEHCFACVKMHFNVWGPVFDPEHYKVPSLQPREAPKHWTGRSCCTLSGLSYPCSPSKYIPPTNLMIFKVLKGLYGVLET